MSTDRDAVLASPVFNEWSWESFDESDNEDIIRVEDLPELLSKIQVDSDDEEPLDPDEIKEILDQSRREQADQLRSSSALDEAQIPDTESDVEGEDFRANDDLDLFLRREQEANSDQKPPPVHLESRSLYLFAGDNPIRLFFFRLMNWKWFERFILLTILLNCLALALYDPVNRTGTRNMVLEYADYVFLVIFTVEFMIKAVAMGFVIHKGAYLRDPWNMLDFAVVCAGYVTLFANQGNLNVLRVFRVLRPLRLINGLPGMRRLVASLLKSMPLLLNAAVLLVFFFLIFGIAAINLFDGVMQQHCVAGGDFDDSVTCAFNPGWAGGVPCDYGYCRNTGVNPNFGYTAFDNFGIASLTLFQCITLEGWIDISFQVMDATTRYAAFYFALVIIIGNFFFVNLFLSIVAVMLLQIPEESSVKNKKPPGRISRFSKQLFRRCRHWMKRDEPQRWLFRVLTKIVTHPLFDIFVMMLIVMNCVLLALPFKGMSTVYANGLEMANLVLTVLFTIEAVMKLLAFGVWKYFSDGFNAFDFVIVLIGWMEIVVTGSGGLTVLRVGRLARILRAARLLRAFKMASKWDGLRILIQACVKVGPLLGYYFILFFIVMFMFTVMGMQLFGGMFFFPEGVPRMYFDTFYWALITVFIMMTGENWNEVMWDGLRSAGWVSLIYFLLFNWIANYLMLNLFLSVLLDVFSSIHRDEKQKLKEKMQGSGSKLFKFSGSRLFKKSSTSNNNLSDSRPSIEMSDMANSAADADIVEVDDANEENPKRSDRQITEEERLFMMQKAGTTKLRSITMVDQENQSTWDRSDDDDGIFKRPLNSRSLWLLGSDNWLRRRIAAFVGNRWFEYFIIMLIVLSCIQLAIDDPAVDPASTYGQVMFYLNVIFTTIFFIEMCLKIVAYGMILHEHAYWRNGWDILDGTIVLISIMSLAVNQLNLGFIRALRALRPIRIFVRFRSMQIILASLFKTLQSLPNVILVTLFFWIVFAILGLQLFLGEMDYCNDDSVIDRAHCRSNYQTEEGNWEDREWLTPDANFDNFFIALLTVFKMSTIENWQAVLFQGVDVVGPNLQPQREAAAINAWYFVAMIVFGSWFVIGLFIGTIIDNFNRIRMSKDYKGSMFLTDSQREWVQLQRVMLSVKPKKYHMQEKPSWIRRVCATVSLHPWFDNMLMILIVFNMIILCTKHFQQAKIWDDFQFYSDIVFTIIFVLEAVLKLIALFPRVYFRSYYNCLDFFIAIVSVIGLFLSSAGSIVKIFRVLRVARVFKLFRIAARLRMILKTLVLSIPAFINIGSLVGLVFFIYGIAGMNLFYDLPEGEYIDHNSNFRTFFSTLYVLLRVATGEVWDEMMEEIRDSKPIESLVYFISFILIGTFLFLQLFVAVVLENFSFVTGLEEGGELSLDDLNRFKKAWAKYDRKATQYIELADVMLFLRDLKPPLGIGKISDEAANEFIAALELPVIHEGDKVLVFFPDLLLCLTDRVYGQDLPEGELYNAIYKQWRKAFPKVRQHQSRQTLQQQLGVMPEGATTAAPAPTEGQS